MSPHKLNRWFAIFAALLILPSTLSAKTRVSNKAFGHTSEGTAVELYSLQDGKVEVGIITYGGIVVSLRTPDRNGKLDDIVPVSYTHLTGRFRTHAADALDEQQPVSG